jgi:AcrR family transcriptional regulator
MKVTRHEHETQQFCIVIRVSTVPLARTSGRPRDSQTDAALIEAVLDLVAEGATLSGLSFVAIADRAGVSRNSLYRRWRTKDALYLDVLASVSRPISPLPGDSVRGDAVEVMTRLAERCLDERANQMMRALGAEAAVFPDLHTRYFDEVVGPRRAALIAIIERGIGTGEIDRDIDVHLAAELLVAPILLRVWSWGQAELGPTEWSRQIADHVFAGLAPRPPADDLEP